MSSGFSARNAITDAKDLYGRDELMNQLISLANNRHSVSITGLRRFGKTSVLMCVESSLRNDSNSNVYPIYFDFKEVGSIIKGTDNVYRYMISRFVARLSIDKIFEYESDFKKIKIKPTNEWEDIYEQIAEVNSVRIQGLFESIALFFSEYMGKTILFLIDEYEWLFRFSFDNPVGFMKLRNFSSKTLPNGINPFCFWIAGSTSWEYLCSLTGSGELNVIDAPPIYLGPIDFKAFCAMWQNEISHTIKCTDKLRSSEDFAFKASGGIPYYGKLIGGHIVSTDTIPTHSILKSYFHEMIPSLQNEEKSILNELSKIPRNYKKSKFLNELLDKGLIILNGHNYEIRIGFLKEFLVSTRTHLDSVDSILISEIITVTDKINELMININRTNDNKHGKYIFKPVNDDAALFKDLRTPCHSLELFSDFASSLYKIIFEKTKENKGGTDVNMATLPTSFKKNNRFIQIVDIMRHSFGGGHLMDTFSRRPDQISKPDMLLILLGNKNEPSTPEEFLRLQISTLNMFEKELQLLQRIVFS